ncbi:hypothetical protein RSOLAG1IB_01951 [Rhizoctonia solani AG-1 IB]|uniref:HD/PDEase domain-containing protein n=1 Tax=Thanatephorus cucumeris (strain AG1-IB / isolate 7/3/14) TaxID=1108050 RepID=A0A0B7FI79_THACB|nr:hypothetical protein RSOLAG1IB_01951 [Rhizoctonia solani AG-1 IB]
MTATSTEYPTTAQKAVIAAAEELMEKAMKKYDPSHDAYHVNRVRRTALALAKSQSPQPDLLVVELAALLHDVLDKKYVTPEEAADADAYFRPFFESVRDHVDLLQDGRAKLVVRVIENVSWSTEKKLRAENKLEPWHESCIELHCVQDADRLDAIGAFGIMRVAAYSAAVNRPLHAPPGDSEVSETSVQHFHDKLLHIKDRLKTPQGRELGAQRHQLMLQFLDAVDKEYEVAIPTSV